MSLMYTSLSTTLVYFCMFAFKFICAQHAVFFLAVDDGCALSQHLLLVLALWTMHLPTR